MKYLVPISRSAMTTNLMEEFDKIFNELFKSSLSTIKVDTTKSQQPKVNAYKKGDSYCIDAFVPHASKEDIDVEIEDRLLSITVKSRQDKEVKDDDYLIREVSKSQCARVIQLGDEIDTESASVSLANGVLHIEFKGVKPETNSKVKKLSIGTEQELFEKIEK